jgi:hypothetical protein
MSRIQERSFAGKSNKRPRSGPIPQRAIPPRSVFAIARDGGVLKVVPDTGAVAPVADPGTFPRGTVEVELSPDGTRLPGPVRNGDPQVQLVDATTWGARGSGKVQPRWLKSSSSTIERWVRAS